MYNYDVISIQLVKVGLAKHGLEIHIHCLEI